MKKQLLFIGATLLPMSLLAQSADSSTSWDATMPEELEPVIIRSIRASQAMPFSTSTLQKKDINAMNQGQDIPYILQQEASLVVSSDAGTGIGYTNMSIRGSDATRINFTINGIPVNNSESQGTFLVNIPDMASSTQSIQIQRGVGSSTNGGSAFGGNVSVNNMTNETTAGGSINATIGSFNTQKLTLQTHTGRLKNNWAFDVRLSQIQSNGYIDRSNANMRSLQFLSSWNINRKSKLTINYMLGHEKTGQAWNGLSDAEMQENRRQNTLGLMPNGTYYKNQTDNYQQQFYQLFYDYKFTPFLKAQAGLFLTRGAGYYEEYRTNDKYSTYWLPDYTTAAGDTFSQTDVIRQLWLDNYFYGGVYNLMYEKDKLTLTFGGMVAQFDGKHYGEIMWASQGIEANHRWYDLDANKTEINHYLKGVYQLTEQWSIYGDLQYRFVDYNMYGFRKNTDLKPAATYNFINPKVGTQYILHNTANNVQKLYLSYAKANREPNRDDFEANVVETPQHEQLHDVELGYHFKNKKITLAANIYYMLYKNQLVLNGKINDVGAYTRVNVDNSYRSGIELIASYNIHKAINISANATFSQNKIKTFNEYIDNWDTWEQEIVSHKNTDIALSPNTIAAMNIEFLPLKLTKISTTYNQLSIMLQHKYVGKQYLDNTSNNARSLDAYHVTNLRLNYSLPIKKYTIHAGFSINNLFSTLYVSNGYTYAYSEGAMLKQSNYYFPQASRFVMFNVGIQF
jgi:iron complex outermembrane receptor protein